MIFYNDNCRRCKNHGEAIRSTIYRDEIVLDGGCKITGFESPKQNDCPLVIEAIENGNSSGCAFCSKSELEHHVCAGNFPCNSPRQQCLSCGKLTIDKLFDVYCLEQKCIYDEIEENERMQQFEEKLNKER